MSSRPYVADDYEFIRKRAKELEHRTYTSPSAKEVVEIPIIEAIDFQCFKHGGYYYYRPISQRAKDYVSTNIKAKGGVIASSGWLRFDRLYLDIMSADAGANPEFTKESISPTPADKQWP